MVCFPCKVTFAIQTSKQGLYTTYTCAYTSDENVVYDALLSNALFFKV